jgi:uncharacterized membrane protein YkvA (DUF1232 family)
VVLKRIKKMSETHNFIGGGNPIKKLGQFKLFIQMIKAHFNKSYPNMAGWVIPALIFAVVYVISPLDFDFIPIVGWIDDAAIVALVYKFIAKEIKKYEDWRSTNITLN